MAFLPSYINRALVIIDKPPHMQSSECTSIVRKLISEAAGSGLRVSRPETRDPRPQTIKTVRPYDLKTSEDLKTSASADAREDSTHCVRKTIKAGHAGTLDPNVTGVLPIAIGKATHLISHLALREKEYVCICRIMGKFGKEEIERALKSFEGKIEQIPPKQSAVKKVRRIREIYALKLLEAKNLVKRTDILFRVSCQAGTYIRVLCEDVGKKLGARAFMVELRRTKVGAITENEAITLHRLRALIQKGESAEFSRFVKPIEHYIPSKLVVANDAAVANVKKGMALYSKGIVSGAEKLAEADYVRITSQSGEIVAIGKYGGNCVKLLRVFV